MDEIIVKINFHTQSKQNAVGHRLDVNKSSLLPSFPLSLQMAHVFGQTPGKLVHEEKEKSQSSIYSCSGLLRTWSRFRIALCRKSNTTFSQLLNPDTFPTLCLLNQVFVLKIEATKSTLDIQNNCLFNLNFSGTSGGKEGREHRMFLCHIAMSKKVNPVGLHKISEVSRRALKLK